MRCWVRAIASEPYTCTAVRVKRVELSCIQAMGYKNDPIIARRIGIATVKNTLRPSILG